MTIRRVFLGTLAIASMQANAASTQSPSANKNTIAADIETVVDQTVQKAMNTKHIAGVQVAVVKDQDVVFVKGYGIDRIAPDRNVDAAKSLFRIGSISKTFLWIALMQLEEQGRIQLSDPVNKYLPDELKIPQEGFKQQIYIVDLMNHTTGFEDILQGLFVDPRAIPLPLREQLQKYRPHRVREPSQLFSYSNYGAALAGALVAHVSGMEYEKYVEERIFRPLGLNHTTLREEYAGLAGLPTPMSAEFAADKAVGLEWRANAWSPFPQEHLVSTAPAGSGVSTATDMAKYMNALLHPEILERAGVLKQSTFEGMKQASFQAAPGMLGMHHGFFNAALGQKSILELDNLSHTGSTLHFFSIMVLIPDLRRPPTYRESNTKDEAPNGGPSGPLGIFITTNGAPGRTLLETLPAAILAKLGVSTEHQRPAAPADFKARAAEYEGHYAELRHSYTTAEKIRAMSQISTVSVTDDGYLRVGSGPQSTRAVEVAKDLFKQVDGDATFAFKRDAKGRITHMVAVVGAWQIAAAKLGFFQTPIWYGSIFLLGIFTSLGVVISALRRLITRRGDAPIVARYASISLICSALAWLGAVVALILFVLQLLDVAGQDQILMHFPPPVLQVVMTFATIGAIATAVALSLTILKWQKFEWSSWRKGRHVFVVAIFTLFAITLADWNLIGYRYY